MAATTDKISDRTALRSRAVANLKGPGAKADASAALAVLYELASSTTTAPDALVLLHELQVHQVEVDLQDEELRRSRAELETSVSRYDQLYNHSPVGQLTIDGKASLCALNRTAARLIGFERDFLLGRSFEGFLTPEGVLTLRAMLGKVTQGTPTAFADLKLRSAQDGKTRCLHAAACLDPAGGGFLVGLMEVMGADPAPLP